MENFEYLRNLALLLMVSKLLEIFLQRYRLSKIVPYILTGLILGPFMTGLIKDDAFITICAQIGAVLLVFDAGLSTKITQIRQIERFVFLVAGLGVLFSLLAGAFIYMIFYGFGPIGSENLLKGLFVGIILSSTSLYAIKRLRKQIGGYWDIVVSAATLNNLVVMIVLSLALGVKTNGISIFLVLFRVIMLVVLGYAAALLIRFVLKLFTQNNLRIQNPTLIYVAFCLIMAYFSTRYFGLPDITGAYIAGIALHTIHGEAVVQSKDMDMYPFFNALFFMGVGLKVNLSSFDLRLIVFSLALIVFGLSIKTVGHALGAILGKYSINESVVIGVSMMSGAELSLIAVWKGIEAGLLGASFMFPVICIVFGAQLIIPNVLKRI